MLFLIVLVVLISFSIGIGIGFASNKRNEDVTTPRHYVITYHAVYHPANMPESEAIGIGSQFCFIHCLSTDGLLDYGKAIAALMVRHTATLVIIASAIHVQQKQIMHLEGPPLII